MEVADTVDWSNTRDALAKFMCFFNCTHWYYHWYYYCLHIRSSLFNSLFNVTTMLKILMWDVCIIYYPLFYKNQGILKCISWAKLKQCR